jgi:hypothetical protein
MGGYATEGERVVGRLVEASLRDTDRMWANQRVTDDRKNAEVDFFLALPEAGFVVLEVKGGQTTYDGEQWRQASLNGRSQRVDPVRQARRLQRSGERVALVCYSRGLAAWSGTGSPIGP